MSFLVGLGAIVALWVAVSSVRACARYFVARRTGLRLRRFILGLGPVLAPKAFAVRGLPVQLRLVVPFVRVELQGLAPPEPDEVPRPLRARVLTVLAGIGATAMLAWLGFFCSALGAGTNVATNRIIVLQSGPAQAAGLINDDVIVEVQGRGVNDNNDIRAAIQEQGGAPVRIGVVRGESRRDLVVDPRRGHEGKWDLGVHYKVEHRANSIAEAAEEAALGPFRVVSAAFRPQFVAPIQGAAAPPGAALGAPLGTWYLVPWLLGYFASMLTFISLLPLPGADGARLIALGIEAGFGRPLPLAVERVVSNGSIGCLAWVLVSFVVAGVLVLFR